MMVPTLERVVYAEGQSVTGLVLDGTNDYVTLPAGVAGCQNLTIATWVYGTAGTRGSVFRFRIRHLGIHVSHASGVEGDLRFVINDGVTEEAVSAGAFPSNQWTHVAVSLEGTTGKIYVNGLLRSVNDSMTVRSG